MKAIKFFVAAITVILIMSNSTFAQEKPDTTKSGQKMMRHNHQMMHDMMTDSSMQNKMHNMKMMQDSSHQMKMDMKDMKEMEHGTTAILDSSAIRKGVIDLKAIDENNDSKVFQDQMDFNVISDKTGECPLCGMKLKEVTLEKAKEDLLKHNFKVK